MLRDCMFDETASGPAAHSYTDNSPTHIPRVPERARAQHPPDASEKCSERSGAAQIADCPHPESGVRIPDRINIVGYLFIGVRVPHGCEDGGEAVAVYDHLQPHLRHGSYLFCRPAAGLISHFRCADALRADEHRGNFR
jgi:hypothetical protein